MASSPQQLIDAALRFCCIPEGLQGAVIVALLNRISASDPTPVVTTTIETAAVTSGHGDPFHAPTVSVQIYIDEDTNNEWHWYANNWHG